MSEEDSGDHENIYEKPPRKQQRQQTIFSKILNRSATGYFSSPITCKSNQETFTPKECQKICLKDIIPHLSDHIFMGLTSCGNFLISHKRNCCESESSINYDFDNSGFKYELFFWVYKPQMPLRKYYVVNLFDDHGAEDIKYITMTQWSSYPDTLIVHGSSEIEDHNSFVSVLRIPKLGCVSCKKLRESDTVDRPFQAYELCIKCNLAIHIKYRFNESTQKFDPKIHLNAPGYIIICETSLIHVLSIELDMQKTVNHGSGIIDQKYLKTSSCDEKPRNTAHDDIKPISIVEQILADFSEYDAECLVPDENHLQNGCENQEATTKGNLPISKEAEDSPLITNPVAQATLLEAAAKTYEFQEENEKCEKISIFRKRRLADKKYEFSEENTENIIPFNRTRNRTTRRPIYHQHRKSPHPHFRSPCGSPVANQVPSIMSPPGFRSPSYYAYRSSPNPHMFSPTRQARMNCGLTTAAEDAFKFLPGAELPNEDNKYNKDFPTFSKKIVNFYVEEDDANSVVTCDEDDCISPGYHLSLEMQVHGACYSKLQIVSKATSMRLRSPRAIVTQNSFDVETFSIYIANTLCNKNNKRYGILFDLAFEIINVCPLSQTFLCVLIVQFTASDFDKLSHCFNCLNDSDCFAHRKLFESTCLFTWEINSSDWKVLDYGQLKHLTLHPTRGNRQEILIKKLQRCVRKVFGNGSLLASQNLDFDHLRILDSNEDKSKQSLLDRKNGIEIYRRQPFDSPSTVSSPSSNYSESSDYEIESCDESPQ